MIDKLEEYPLNAQTNSLIKKINECVDAINTRKESVVKEVVKAKARQKLKPTRSKSTAKS